MAETVGRVEFLVGLDGSRLPAEARRLGKAIAKEGQKSGDEFGEEFESAAGPHISKFAKTISQKLSREGKLGGRKLVDDFADIALKRVREKRFDIANALFDQHGFDDLVQRFGNIDDAVDHLRTSISALHQEHLFDDDGTWRGLVITKEEMGELNDTVEKFAANLEGRLRPALQVAEENLEDVGEDLDKVTKASDRTRKSIGSQGSAWKRLSANTRQWTLIIGAVAAGMEGLAGLGSAAGAGLLVLGSGIGSLVVGAAALIPILSNLFQDIEDAPAAMRPVLAEFVQFRQGLGKVSDAIAQAAFDQMDGAFVSLLRTAQKLTPAMQKVSAVLGRATKRFADAVSSGEGFELINTFIEDSAEILDELIGIVGKFGGALLHAFNRANPLTQKFIGYLGDLVDKFDEFTHGDGFDEWLRHADAVFGAFGRLLGGVAQTLNNLVTDESIGRLVNFMDNLTAFITGPGEDLLQILGELDIFGLLAEALATFGKALEPLAGPMQDLADAVNDVIQAGIDKLAPIIEDIAEALAPFVQGLADFMDEHPDRVADALLILAAAFVVFKGVKGIAGVAAAMGTFVGKMDDATKKAPGWKTIIGGSLGGILAAIPSNFDGEVTGGDIATSIIGGMVAGFLGSGGNPVGALVGAMAAMITSAVADLTDQKKGPWENGLSQLFDPNDRSGAIIGPIKDWFAGPFKEAITPVAANFQGAIDVFWAQIAVSFQNGWNGIVEFFTVSIPGFWNGFVAALDRGWKQISAAAAIGWALFTAPWVNGWNTIVTYLTVQVPTAFRNWGAGISNGFKQISAVVGTAWALVKQAFVTGWNLITLWFSNEVPRFFSQAGQNIYNAVKGLGTFFSRGFQAVWDTVSGWVGKIASKVQEGLSNLPLIGGLFQSAAGSIVGAAAGTILNGPRVILAGEAGPEAIVPLRRPLSRVDPSVRWLSAIAQGKNLPGMASGGVVGAGRQVTIASGAIQINAPDPWRAATETVNRIVERVG